MSSRPSAPYLTVVAASRNDDHGGDPLVRTQIFINCFARQCEKHRLPAELILIDWNPVAGRPGLGGVLRLPTGITYCELKVITVPAALHERFKYADRMTFYQMIAKNAGIRRARGEFTIATNIDIIFSDELIAFIARRKLDPRKMYRVDRYDIQSNLPPTFSLDETLDYAWSHPVRSNRRFNPKPLVESLYGDDLFKRHVQPSAKIGGEFKDVALVEDGGVWSVQPKRDTPLENLHTNACGDFTLLSREGWDAVTGYPEFEAFSFNIDSVGIAAAHYAGFEEVALLPPCVCFHIEHSLGSGWTPEGETKLFNRLREKEILNPEWHVLQELVNDMRQGKEPTALNESGWGLAEFKLPEELLLSGQPGNATPHPHPYSAPASLPVSALSKAFDLDRMTVWVERKRIEDIKRWAEEAEKRVAEARTVAVQNEKWAREADASANTLVQRTTDWKTWAQRAEKLLALEKERAEGATTWAKKTEQLLTLEKERFAEATAWAKEAEGRATAAKKLVAKTEAWARRSDALLLAANQRVTELEAHLRDHREWALRTEARALELEKRLQETSSWAQRCEAEIKSLKAGPHPRVS